MMEKIKDYLEKGNIKSLQALLKKMRPEDIAHILNSLEENEKNTIFKLLNVEEAAIVLSEVDDSSRDDLLVDLDDGYLSHILEIMPPNNAADVLGELPLERRRNLLQLMEEKESREVKKLLKYDEKTAGGIMTTEFVSLNENLTSDESIKQLRNIALDWPSFYIYVSDKEGHLKGVVRLRKLIATKGDAYLKDIMNSDLITVKPHIDQEEVAVLVEKYNLLALPVVDEENKLVGIVTADDVLEVMEEEATEDIYKMAGTNEEEILDSSIFKVARVRLPWLLTTFLGGLVSASIIGMFKPTLNQVLILAAFIPVIMGMGGNIGIQSSTIVVRGIATGRVIISQVWEILFREVRIGAIMGLICGTVVGIVAHFWAGEIILGIVVGISMFIAITVAATIGALTPIVFKRLNIDPAIATGPFVTTSNDITGLLIYFGLATLLMKYMV